MAHITLYHVGESRSMRTLWLLNELNLKLGLPFELIELPWDLKHLRAPEYLAIHPLGRVPALVDDGRVIIESGAIAQYLCAKYDPDGLGRRQDHPEWLGWIQWIHYSETIAVHAACLVQQRFFIKPHERSAAVANLESKRLMKALEVIEHELARREHLLDSGYSAADIGVCYSIHMAKLFFEPANLSRVQAYYARLSQRPAFLASAKPAMLTAPAP